MGKNTGLGNEKLLSQVGKEVMIKAVVQSIPVYSMSVFKLPVGLCKDIEAMIRKFWWRNGDSKKIHWIKWSSLCSSKSIGGMGFRDLSLIMLCLQNRFGIFSITKKLYCTKLLVLSISRMVVFLRLLYIQSALMRGGLFCKREMLSTKEQFGGWGMGS